MGPVNWLAVAIATGLAVGLAFLSYGSFSPRQKSRAVRLGSIATSAALLFVPAAMLGHMFARTGAEVLAARPWLYFMMAGGAALALIVPFLCFTYARRRLPPGIALADSLFALAVFLMMGTVFWALG